MGDRNASLNCLFLTKKGFIGHLIDIWSLNVSLDIWLNVWSFRYNKKLSHLQKALRRAHTWRYQLSLPNKGDEWRNRIICGRIVANACTRVQALLTSDDSSASHRAWLSGYFRNAMFLCPTHHLYNLPWQCLLTFFWRNTDSCSQCLVRKWLRKKTPWGASHFLRFGRQREWMPLCS